MTGISSNIVAPGATVELVVGGLQFTEGPVWYHETGSLVFSDIRGNVIYRLEADGKLGVYRKPSNFANGSTRDCQGRLVSCEHGTSRIVREEADGTLNVLASHWQQHELNSPNDVIADCTGAIWFTDPVYGRLAEYGIERPQQLGFQGVYCIAPDGQLHLAADDFDQPNGLCIGETGKTLYVSDTRRFHIRHFNIAGPGKLEDNGIFAVTSGQDDGCPDGLKLDASGYVFSCAPGGIQVFSPDAELLETLAFPEEATNFTWGGSDLCTLFVTAQTSVYRLKLSRPGRAWPFAS